ncbi:glycosyltransferase [Providencia stuartii]|nr:glycosyltransferase [Providencia stuartii]
MRILIIITGLNLGGAEVQVSQLCDHLAADGNSIEIISMMGEIQVSPRNKNIIIHQLNMKKNPISLLSSFLKTKKLIKSFKPDIVHSHLFHANIYSRIIKLFLWNLNLVNTEHSKYIGSSLRAMLYKLTKAIPNYCTNVSIEALNNFTTNGIFSKKKSTCIYNGIDTEKFNFSTHARQLLRQEHNIASDTILLLSVGRLVLAKDYNNLLNAFSRISIDNIKLWIIGDGPELSSIKNKIAELNLEKKVALLGKKNNICDYMSACDLFISSSAWEGFGLVIAEAMSCEKIVVATDAGGVREVVSQYGFIAPIRDHITLCEKINFALNIDSCNSLFLKRNARQHVIDNFAFPIIKDKWLNLYNDILKK